MDPVEREKLIRVILDTEYLVNRIERKGVLFREFMKAKNAKGHLPQFRLELVDGPRFVYSADEFEALRRADETEQQKRHEEAIASVPSEEMTEEMKVFRPKRLNFIELYEEDSLAQLNVRLNEFDFSLEDYLIASRPLIDIIGDEGFTMPYSTLKEVLVYVRENGRKGIEIQRFKGLGEMNADQLWETTMDPKVRTLIRVSLNDAIAADQMFSMLMGEDVPPRRNFIEKYALSVENLDI